MDMTTLPFEILGNGFFYFPKEEHITWDGRRHAIVGGDFNMPLLPQLMPFVSNIDFDSPEEVAQYVCALLNNLEEDPGLRMPRERIAPGIRKALRTGDLTGITLANLCACNKALLITVKNGTYAVAYDARLANGIPQFFNLVARMIWDMRQTSRSKRGMPFAIVFVGARNVDADQYLGDVPAPVPGAQAFPGLMFVASAPDISLGAATATPAAKPATVAGTPLPTDKAGVEARLVRDLDEVPGRIASDVQSVISSTANAVVAAKPGTAQLLARPADAATFEPEPYAANEEFHYDLPNNDELERRAKPIPVPEPALKPEIKPEPETRPEPASAQEAPTASVPSIAEQTEASLGAGSDATSTERPHSTPAIEQPRLEHAPNAPKRKKARLFILLLILAVLAIGALVYCQNNTDSAKIDRAESCEANGDYLKAAKLYSSAGMLQKGEACLDAYVDANINSDYEGVYNNLNSLNHDYLDAHAEELIQEHYDWKIVALECQDKLCLRYSGGIPNETTKVTISLYLYQRKCGTRIEYYRGISGTIAVADITLATTADETQLVEIPFEIDTAVSTDGYTGYYVEINADNEDAVEYDSHSGFGVFDFDLDDAGKAIIKSYKQ